LFAGNRQPDLDALTRFAIQYKVSAEHECPAMHVGYALALMVVVCGILAQAPSIVGYN
jgi:hypothetical protein